MNREIPVYTEKQYTSSVVTVGYPYLGEAFCLFFHICLLLGYTQEAAFRKCGPLSWRWSARRFFEKPSVDITR